MIERSYLVAKRDGYHEAYMSALSAANANHGAMQALDELIAKIDAQPKPGEVESNPTSPEKIDAAK